MRIEEMSSEEEWETYVCSSRNGTFYHSLKWKEVIERSFPHQALYLVARDMKGKIVGVLPGFVTESMRVTVYDSIPYSDYGGPLVDPSCSPYTSIAFLVFLKDLSLPRTPSYARLRVINKLLDRPLRSPMSYTESVMGAMEIDLTKTPSKYIWSNLFSSNRRKKFKQMERRGLQTREARTRADLQAFYNLYLRNMNYIGANAYQFRFIENMWNMLHPSHIRIWILEDRRPVAAKLFFRFGNKSFSAYVGIDRSQRSVYPFSRYLTWTEIKKAEEEGLSCVSLGSTSNDPDSKYFLQKSSLGCMFYPQTIMWIPLRLSGRILVQLRSVSLSIWKGVRASMPNPLVRFLESRLVRL